MSRDSSQRANSGRGDPRARGNPGTATGARLAEARDDAGLRLEGFRLEEIAASAPPGPGERRVCVPPPASRTRRAPWPTGRTATASSGTVGTTTSTGRRGGHHLGQRGVRPGVRRSGAAYPLIADLNRDGALTDTTGEPLWGYRIMGAHPPQAGGSNSVAAGDTDGDGLPALRQADDRPRPGAAAGLPAGASQPAPVRRAVGSRTAERPARRQLTPLWRPERPGSVPIWTCVGSFGGLSCSARSQRAVVNPCGAPPEARRGAAALPWFDENKGAKHTLAGGLMCGIPEERT